MQSTTERLTKYEDAWASKMIDIWRDRVRYIKVAKGNAEAWTYTCVECLPILSQLLQNKVLE